MSETGDKKLFLGGRLRRLRRDLNVSQAAMAAELGLSPSYLNHLERNQRPLTASVLVRLAETYDLDIRTFVSEGEGADVSDLAEIFADPMFKDLAVPRLEIADLADTAPGVSEAIVRLYQALLERRRTPDLEAVEKAERHGVSVKGTPSDWVRDFIQSHKNYFPELDEPSEALIETMAPDPHGFIERATARLKEQHAVQVRIAPAEVMPDALRRYDHHRRRLLISELLDGAGRAFAVAYQLAWLELRDRVEQMSARATPPDKATERLLRVSLLNYAAAALLMPYAKIHASAESSGYDIDFICARFGVSFEQACHRLTTLGKPGVRGVPFFMLRVDPAGNVSKRFAGTNFPFSRFGGACPRWNIHASFRTPGRIITQIIETTDGERYFTLSRTVSRVASAYTHEDADLAIGMGCELKHAPKLVYARGIDLASPRVTPIGPACRLCERPACPQRAAEPLSRTLAVDEQSKSVSPFPFSAA